MVIVENIMVKIHEPMLLTMVASKFNHHQQIQFLQETIRDVATQKPLRR